MSESELSLDNVKDHLERAIDADPDEKDYFIRHALQDVIALQEKTE